MDSTSSQAGPGVDEDYFIAIEPRRDEPLVCICPDKSDQSTIPACVERAYRTAVKNPSVRQTNFDVGATFHHHHLIPNCTLHNPLARLVHVEVAAEFVDFVQSHHPGMYKLPPPAEADPYFSSKMNLRF